MRTVRPLIILMLAALPWFTACKKEQPPAGAGVLPSINTTSLVAAFPSPPPDVQTLLDNIKMSIRSSMLPDALKNLDQLNNLPNITQQQKDAVNDVAEQVKKRMAQLEGGAK